jgi:hypothetical protein
VSLLGHYFKGERRLPFLPPSPFSLFIPVGMMAGTGENTLNHKAEVIG